MFDHYKYIFSLSNHMDFPFDFLQIVFLQSSKYSFLGSLSSIDSTR